MQTQLTPEYYPDIRWVQQQLQVYGYPIEVTGELDITTKQTLRVFMMHFRPDNYPGRVDGNRCVSPSSKCLNSEWFMESLEQSLDANCYAIIDSLVRRYVPKEVLQKAGIVSLQEYLLDAQYTSSISMRP